LSEVRMTSDITLVFWRCLVRSLLIFGHHLGFLVMPCPKFAHLRTSPYFFGTALSEVRSSSGIIGGFLGFGIGPDSLVCNLIFAAKTKRLLRISSDSLLVFYLHISNGFPAKSLRLIRL